MRGKSRGTSYANVFRMRAITLIQLSYKFHAHIKRLHCRSVHCSHLYSHMWMWCVCVWVCVGVCQAFGQIAGKKMLWYTQNYLFTQLFHGSGRWTLFLHIYSYECWDTQGESGMNEGKEGRKKHMKISSKSIMNHAYRERHWISAQHT